MTKKCRECEIEKPECEFSWRRKLKGQRQSYCKLCMKKRNAAHYKKTSSKYKDNRDALRQRNRKFVADYKKKHPCVDCGEKDIVVLEFDHLRDKEDNISVMAHRPTSLETIKAEIAKCDVVCANCHRRRTIRRVLGTD